MTLNRLTLIGFVGADAEEKTNSKGSPYTVFSVATKTSWKNADGAWDSRTEWHRCVANSKIAAFAATLKRALTCRSKANCAAASTKRTA